MPQTPSDSREGLRFFGRINASVSHEIKNVLAVVNEAAGLVGDLSHMAERGMPVAPERLQKAVGTIQGQVRRGDDLVRNLNAFAHSIDDDSRETDLAELLQLTVALSTRMADMKQVGLAIGDCEAVSLSTNPFDLMRLLHSSLAAALESLDGGDTLTIGLTPASGGARFTIAARGKAAFPASGGPPPPPSGLPGVVATVDEGGGLELLIGQDRPAAA